MRTAAISTSWDDLSHSPAELRVLDVNVKESAMPEHRDHSQDDRHADARHRRHEVVDVLTEALWTLLCRGDGADDSTQCAEKTAADVRGAGIGNDATH